MKLLKSLIIALIIVFFCSFFIFYNTEIAHLPAGWRGGVLISSMVTLIASIALLTLGLAFHFALQYLNKSKFVYYFLGGASPGFVVVFLFKPLGDDAMDVLLIQGALFSIYGAFTASIFWFVFYRLKS